MRGSSNLSTQINLWPHQYPGRLIAVDGIDGSGKSSLSREICAYARASGINCKIEKMPSTETRLLPYFEEYIIDPIKALNTTVDLAALCIILLGDRLMTIRTQVLPALSRGEWVICDRYIFTPFAEMYAVSTSRKDFEALLRLASMFPKPDLGLITMVEVGIATERIRLRESEDRYELHEELFRNFAAGFEVVARENALRLVNTDGPKSEVFAAIKQEIGAFL